MNGYAKKVFILAYGLEINLSHIKGESRKKGGKDV